MSIFKKLVVFAVFFVAISVYAAPKQYTVKQNKILIKEDTSLTINLTGSKFYKFPHGIGYNVVDAQSNKVVDSAVINTDGDGDITLELKDLAAGQYVQLYAKTFLGTNNNMSIGNKSDENQTLSFINDLGLYITYDMSISENKTFGSPVPGAIPALIICGALAVFVVVRERKNKALQGAAA